MRSTAFTKLAVLVAVATSLAGAGVPKPAMAITIPFTDESLASALDFGRKTRPEKIGSAPEWNFAPADGSRGPDLTIATAFYYVSLCEADDPRSTDICTKVGHENAGEIDLTVALENPSADANASPAFVVTQARRRRPAIDRTRLNRSKIGTTCTCERRPASSARRTRSRGTSPSP